MIHYSKPILTHPSSSYPGTTMYLMGAFLMYVLDYGFVSASSFPLSSSHTIGKSVWGPAGNAILNLGSGKEKHVSIPIGSHAVTDFDVGRLLTIKSQNPVESGIYRITSSSLSNNVLVIDYSSTNLPVSASIVRFAVLEQEVSASTSWSSGSNNSAGYNSSANSSASRLILQVPLSSSLTWQVRLCLESNVDVGLTCQGGFTVAPGFFGNGVEISRTPCLHGPLFFDTKNPQYKGTATGPSVGTTNNLWLKQANHVLFVGDDVSGSCVVANLSSQTRPISWGGFGIIDTPDSLSQNDVMSKLFTVGFAGTASLSFPHRSGFQSEGQLSAVGWSSDLRTPVPATLSLYEDANNPNISVYSYVSSSLSFIDGTHELLDAQFLVGTYSTAIHPLSASLFTLAPDVIGTIPMALFSRRNLSPMLTASSWLHIVSGVNFQWDSGIGWVSSSFIAYSSGSSQLTLLSQLTSSQLSMWDVNLIGQDPVEYQPQPPVSNGEGSLLEGEILSEVDGSRFKKTYSYFRQPPKPIDYTIKGSPTQR